VTLFKKILPLSRSGVFFFLESPLPPGRGVGGTDCFFKIELFLATFLLETGTASLQQRMIFSNRKTW